MKNIKNIISFIALILSFVYVCKIICQPVELRKVFHHTNDTGTLTMGKLIFYFDIAPYVEVKKAKKTEFINEYQFIFKDTNILRQETIKMIDAVVNARYAYEVEITNHPDAVSVALTIDERDIGFTSQEFIAITGENAISFNFYSKQVLDTLQKKQSVPVLQTTCNTQRSVVCIDCGHGGADTGAIGTSGVMEKNVCLALGTQVGDTLKKNGIQVVYTRDKDVFVPLDARAVYAKKNNADMFVSIHANATTNKTISGIETYCCNPHFIQNRFSTITKQDANIITEHEKKRFSRSMIAAQSVHTQLCYRSEKVNEYFVDRSIKHGAAQVLFANELPSVLIEVGFVSHPHEEQLLSSASYQKELVEAIVSGIMQYIV